MFVLHWGLGLCSAVAFNLYDLKRQSKGPRQLKPGEMLAVRRSGAWSVARCLHCPNMTIFVKSCRVSSPNVTIGVTTNPTSRIPDPGTLDACNRMCLTK